MLTDLLRTKSFKNLSALGISEFLVRALKFLLITLAARRLGPDLFGLFNYVLAIAALVAVVGDFGINRIITRNVAKEKTERKLLVSKYITSLGVQAVLLLIYSLIGGSILLFTQDLVTAALFLVLALFTSINVTSDYLWSFYRGFEDMKPEAIAKTVQAVIATIIGVTLLYSPEPLFGLAVAYVLGAIATLILAIVGFKRYASLWTRPQVRSWVNLVKQSWPIAIVAVSAFVFNEIDSIMLGALGKIREVGYYSAAYKIVSGLLIPVFIINQVLYPKFARADFWVAIRLVRQNIVVNLTLYTVFLVLIWEFGTNLVVLLFGFEYSAAAPALFILAAATILNAMSYPLSSFTIAKNKLSINLWLSIAAAIINIVLNVFLIPPYGYLGAAVATLITYGFLLLGYSICLLNYSRNQLK